MRARTLALLAVTFASAMGLSTKVVGGAITLSGQVTSCVPVTSCAAASVAPGAPTLTRVTFDHQQVDLVGRQTWPIGRVNGTIDIWLAGDLIFWEQNDFYYWNEIVPGQPRHGWSDPGLIFLDGRLVGLWGNTPGNFHADMFDFWYEPGGEISVRGTLANKMPEFLAEPGTLGLLGFGLAGLGLSRRRKAN
jgi:hypothetical protein